jgi:two-component system, response regulator PdtaR
VVCLNNPNETVLGPTNLSTRIESERGVRKYPIVLVCEDDCLVRMQIVDYLIDHGCTVMEAGSGEDAVAFINGPDQQLDVLFTDIRLGGTLNGWDVAEIFRDRFPNLRVVYASGHTDQRRDVAETEFFAKPYRLDDILEACKR